MADSAGQSGQSNPSSDSQSIPVNSFRARLASKRIEWKNQRENIENGRKADKQYPFDRDHPLADLEEMQQDLDDITTTMTGKLDLGAKSRTIMQLLGQEKQRKEGAEEMTRDMARYPEYETTAQEGFDSWIEGLQLLAETENGENLSQVLASAYQRKQTMMQQETQVGANLPPRTLIQDSQHTSPTQQPPITYEQQVEADTFYDDDAASDDSLYQESYASYDALETQQLAPTIEPAKVATHDAYYLPRDYAFIKNFDNVPGLGERTVHGWRLSKIVHGLMNLSKLITAHWNEDKESYDKKLDLQRKISHEQEERANKAESKVVSLERSIRDLKAKNAHLSEKLEEKTKRYDDTHDSWLEKCKELEDQQEAWEKERKNLKAKRQEQRGEARLLRLEQADEITQLKDALQLWRGAANHGTRPGNYMIENPVGLRKEIDILQRHAKLYRDGLNNTMAERDRFQKQLRAIEESHLAQHRRLVALFGVLYDICGMMEYARDMHADNAQKACDAAKDLKSLVRGLRRDIETAQGERDRARTDRDGLRRSLQSQDTAHNEALRIHNEQIAKLQSTVDDYQKQVDEVTKSRDALAEDIQTKTTQLNDAQTSLQRARNEAAQALRDRTVRQQQQTRDQQALEDELEQEKDSRRDVELQLTMAQGNQALVQVHLDNANERIKLLKTDLTNTANKHKTILDIAITERDEARTDLVSATNIIDALRPKLSNSVLQLGARQSKIAFLRKVICDLVRQKKVLGFAVRRLRILLSDSRTELDDIQTEHEEKVDELELDIGKLMSDNDKMKKLIDSMYHLEKDAKQNRNYNRLLLLELERAQIIHRELEEEKDAATTEAEMLEEMLRVEQAQGEGNMARCQSYRELIAERDQELFDAKTKAQLAKDRYTFTVIDLKHAWSGLAGNLALFDADRVEFSPELDLSMDMIDPLLRQSDLRSILTSVSFVQDQSQSGDCFIDRFASNEDENDSGKLDFPEKWNVMEVVKQHYTQVYGQVEESVGLFKHLIFVHKAILSELDHNVVGDELPTRAALLFYILEHIGQSSGTLIFSIIVNLFTMLHSKFRPPEEEDWYALVDSVCTKARHFEDMSILSKACFGHLCSTIWPSYTIYLRGVQSPGFSELAADSTSVLGLLDQATAFCGPGEEIVIHEEDNDKWYFILDIQELRQNFWRKVRDPFTAPRVESRIVLHLNKGKQEVTCMLGDPIVERGIGFISFSWGDHRLELPMNSPVLTASMVLQHFATPDKLVGLSSFSEQEKQGDRELKRRLHEEITRSYNEFMEDSDAADDGDGMEVDV